MAAEPVPSRELDQLHQRIDAAAAELRGRLRRETAPGPRLPDDVVRATSDALRGLRASPSVAAGIGVVLLAVAGVAAALLARRRQ